MEEYGDFLFQFAYQRVNHKQKAEDLVQETFLAAIKNIETFQGKSSIRTWLTSILKRKIIDYYREKSVHQEEEWVESPFQETGEMAGHWKPEFSPQEWTSNPEDVLHQKEFYQALQDCLSRLPDKMRIAFVLKEIDGESTENICKELGISSSNYWIVMHRARLSLRACLEKNWFLGKESNK